MNCLLKPIIEGNIEGGIEVTGRQGRKCKQLLDDFKEMRRYWKLKEKVPDRTLWRTRFGRGCGPVVRQTIKYIFFLPEKSTLYIICVISSRSIRQEERLGAREMRTGYC